MFSVKWWETDSHWCQWGQECAGHALRRAENMHSCPQCPVTAQEACDHQHCCDWFRDTSHRGFVSVLVQAFFQRDTDAAIPCPGSASWIRLRHSCGYLEHSLPGRTGDSTACVGEVTDITWPGQHVPGIHLSM